MILRHLEESTPNFYGDRAQRLGANLKTYDRGLLLSIFVTVKRLPWLDCWSGLQTFLSQGGSDAALGECCDLNNKVRNVYQGGRAKIFIIVCIHRCQTPA